MNEKETKEAIEPIVLGKEGEEIYTPPHHKTYREHQGPGFKVAYFGGVGLLPKLIFGVVLAGILVLGLMFSSVILVLFGIFFVVTILRMILKSLFR